MTCGPEKRRQQAENLQRIVPRKKRKLRVQTTKVPVLKGKF